MLSNARICAAFADARVAQWLVVAFAVLVGGCSADVTRFDFPFFGLTDKGGETGSLPTPPEVDRAAQSGLRRPAARPTARRRPRRRRTGLHAAALRQQRSLQRPAPGLRRLRRSRGQHPRLRATAARRRPGPRRRPLRRPAHGPSARRRARRDHPGAGRRHAVRHLQALRRVDRRADRGQRPGPRLLHQAGPAAGAARRRDRQAGARAARRPCAAGADADPVAAGRRTGGNRRLGGTPHLEGRRVALQHRPPARRDAGRAAARQRHHRADPRARRHGAVGTRHRDRQRRAGARRRPARRAGLRPAPPPSRAC